MTLPDEIDWGSPDVQDLRVSVRWRKLLLGGGYTARVCGQRWVLTLNDFPDEPMFSLIVNGRWVASFTEWPPEWRKP